MAVQRSSRSELSEITGDGDDKTLVTATVRTILTIFEAR